MPAKTDEAVLGVVGVGLMGRGIAQIAAQAGVPVLLFDSRPGGAEEARQTLVSTLATLSSKVRSQPKRHRAASGRLKVANTLEDLKSCTVVVEAIVENLEAKQQLFRALEGVVRAIVFLQRIRRRYR